MPIAPARFQFDPRLATLLGEGYRSSEQALKELVDNAWDADATEVRVTLPDPMTGNPIVIADDGFGMNESEVRNEYLKVARDRRSRSGEVTARFGRRVKGRKGIGKFAGLMAASSMTLVTRRAGQQTTLQIYKEHLLKSSRELEDIDLPLETTSTSIDSHGTSIVLVGLNQDLQTPDPVILRELLAYEYGRATDFTILVNGVVVSGEDLPGERVQYTETVPDAGAVKLAFTISDTKKSAKEPGIVLRIQGKVVGRPAFFGLENDPDIPPKLLRKVFGEVDADGLVDHVTNDWGAVVENSRAYQQVCDRVRQVVRQKLRAVFKEQVKVAQEHREKEIESRLAHLPDHRRELARKALERVLLRFFGESQDRIDTVVGVVLETFERDEYWEVVKEVEAARHAGIARLADALTHFGLVDLAVVGEQAQHRISVLDGLTTLLLDPTTREIEMHTAFEQNLWLLEGDHSLIASNQTLREVVAKYCAAEFRGRRAARRPDLLLAEAPSRKRLLIEFKRPDLAITREHENQAAEYRDDLMKYVTGVIEVLVIGKGPAEGVDVGFRAPGLFVRSYADVISAARTRHDWLLVQMGARGRPELPSGTGRSKRPTGS